MECKEARKGAAALAVLIITSLAIVASAFARADVAPTAAAAPSASCTGAKIGFMGPITGDAAFIGKEQLGFAQYAMRKLAGGKIKLVAGRHAARPGAGVDGRHEVPGERQHHRRRRPGRQPGGARGQPGLQEAQRCRSSRARPRDGADERLDPELLPGRPERQRPGPDDRELHSADPEGEGRLHRRRPDGVLEAARERRAGEPAGRRRHGDTRTRSTRR